MNLEQLKEYEGVDIALFSKWGHLSDLMFKAHRVGKLDKLKDGLEKKLSGPALDAMKYFYNFIELNKERF